MVPEKITKAIEELSVLAVKKGAEKEWIKYISADKVEVPGSWVRWKCQFGCSNYGNSLCCAPFVPPPEKTQELIGQYKHAMLVGFKGTLEEPKKHHAKMNKTLFKLEKEAFFMGFVKALAFAAGTCLLCTKCIIQEDSMKGVSVEIARRYCRHKNKARPSLEAVGIDVFTTVHNAGLELEVINEDNIEKMRHFGLILLE